MGPDQRDRGVQVCRVRVTTRCNSVDEFVASFAPFVDETSIFLGMQAAIAPGAERAFVVQLADGTVVLQGWGHVAEVCAGGTGPLGRTGIRVRFVELTPASRTLLQTLLATRPPAPRAGRDTAPAPPPAMPAPAQRRLPPVPPPRPPAHGSPRVKPSGPLDGISDDTLGSFVESALHEETGSAPPTRRARSATR